MQRKREREREREREEWYLHPEIPVLLHSECVCMCVCVRGGSVCNGSQSRRYLQNLKLNPELATVLFFFVCFCFFFAKTSHCPLHSGLFSVEVVISGSL